MAILCDRLPLNASVSSAYSAVCTAPSGYQGRFGWSVSLTYENRYGGSSSKLSLSTCCAIIDGMSRHNIPMNRPSCFAAMGALPGGPKLDAQFARVRLGHRLKAQIGERRRSAGAIQVDRDLARRGRPEEELLPGRRAKCSGRSLRLNACAAAGPGTQAPKRPRRQVNGLRNPRAARPAWLNRKRVVRDPHHRLRRALLVPMNRPARQVFVEVAVVELRRNGQQRDSRQNQLSPFRNCALALRSSRSVSTK